MLLLGATAAAGISSTAEVTRQQQDTALIGLLAQAPTSGGRIEALVARLADGDTAPAQVSDTRVDIAAETERLDQLAASLADAQASSGARSVDLHPLVADIAGLATAGRQAISPAADLRMGGPLREAIDHGHQQVSAESSEAVATVSRQAGERASAWSVRVILTLGGIGLLSVLVMTLLVGPFAAQQQRQRRRDQLLAESRTNHATYVAQLLDSLDVAVIAMNADGSKATVNAATRHLYGLPSDGVVTPDELEHSAVVRQPGGIGDLAWADQPLLRALRRPGQTAAAELAMRPRTEEDAGANAPRAGERRLRVRAKAVVNDAGEVLGAVATLQDLTSVLTRSQTLTRHAAQLAAINRATRAVLHEENPRHAVCREAFAVSGATFVALFEPDRHGDLVCTASIGTDTDGWRLRADGRSVVAAAYASAQTRIVANLSVHPGVDADLARRVTQLADSPEVGGAWIPVVAHGSCIAVLVVCLPTRQVDQLRDQLPTLEIVAGETAVAIERHNLMIRLATEADTDGLTGAHNRRAWESGLPKALQRSSQSGLPVTVVLLDLDHFKAFNDSHGHPTGDALLREVVQAWQARLRPGDLLARYGGEEFAVLLQECTIDDAHTVAESLRALMPRGQTCSAGAATWDGIESAGGLVERADRALYEAKRSGRNQLVVA